MIQVTEKLIHPQTEPTTPNPATKTITSLAPQPYLETGSFDERLKKRRQHRLRHILRHASSPVSRWVAPSDDISERLWEDIVRTLDSF